MGDDDVIVSVESGAMLKTDGFIASPAATSLTVARDALLKTDGFISPVIPSAATSLTVQMPKDLLYASNVAANSVTVQMPKDLLYASNVAANSVTVQMPKDLLCASNVAANSVTVQMPKDLLYASNVAANSVTVQMPKDLLFASNVAANSVTVQMPKDLLYASNVAANSVTVQMPKDLLYASNVAANSVTVQMPKDLLFASNVAANPLTVNLPDLARSRRIGFDQVPTTSHVVPTGPANRLRSRKASPTLITSKSKVSVAIPSPARRDVFISHASEDKADIARPLAKALSKAGLSVWFDEAELTLGDSLRRKIDDGLKNSQFAVVILSLSFFAKEWPQRELDGLFALEQGNKKILPVWHGVTVDQVREYSPLLADRLGVKTEQGIRRVVTDILRAVRQKRDHQA